MNETIEKYASDPESFRSLELPEALTIVADIALYCAEQKNDALEAAGKTRTDSCLPAQRWYDKEKYWTSVNQNIKKLADLEITRVRQGV